MMPKGSKAPRAPSKKPSPPADFVKRRPKVGKPRRATNASSTDFKAARLHLAEQDVAHSAAAVEGEPRARRAGTPISELLVRVSHHSKVVRRDASAAIADLFASPASTCAATAARGERRGRDVARNATAGNRNSHGRTNYRGGASDAALRPWLRATFEKCAVLFGDTVDGGIRANALQIAMRVSERFEAHEFAAYTPLVVTHVIAAAAQAYTDVRRDAFDATVTLCRCGAVDGAGAGTTARHVSAMSEVAAAPPPRGSSRAAWMAAFGASAPATSATMSSALDKMLSAWISSMGGDDPATATTAGRGGSDSGYTPSTSTVLLGNTDSKHADTGRFSRAKDVNAVLDALVVIQDIACRTSSALSSGATRGARDSPDALLLPPAPLQRACAQAYTSAQPCRLALDTPVCAAARSRRRRQRWAASSSAFATATTAWRAMNDRRQRTLLLFREAFRVVVCHWLERAASAMQCARAMYSCICFARACAACDDADGGRHASQVRRDTDVDDDDGDDDDSGVEDSAMYSADGGVRSLPSLLSEFSQYAASFAHTYIVPCFAALSSTERALTHAERVVLAALLVEVAELSVEAGVRAGADARCDVDDLLECALPFASEAGKARPLLRLLESRASRRARQSPRERRRRVHLRDELIAGWCARWFSLRSAACATRDDFALLTTLIGSCDEDEGDDDVIHAAKIADDSDSGDDSGGSRATQSCASASSQHERARRGRRAAKRAMLVDECAALLPRLAYAALTSAGGTNADAAPLQGASGASLAVPLCFGALRLYLLRRLPRHDRLDAGGGTGGGTGSVRNKLLLSLSPFFAAPRSRIAVLNELNADTASALEACTALALMPPLQVSPPDDDGMHQVSVDGACRSAHGATAMADASPAASPAPAPLPVRLERAMALCLTDPGVVRSGKWTHIVGLVPYMSPDASLAMRVALARGVREAMRGGAFARNDVISGDGEQYSLFTPRCLERVCRYSAEDDSEHARAFRALTDAETA